MKQQYTHLCGGPSTVDIAPGSICAQFQSSRILLEAELLLRREVPTDVFVYFSITTVIYRIHTLGLIVLRMYFISL